MEERSRHMVRAPAKRHPGATMITNCAGLQSMSLSGNYQLANDITDCGANFTPIGNDSAPFTGTLDGNGTRAAHYVVTSVDLATFEIVLDSNGADSGFARDEYRVYAGCDGSIPNADPATFVALNDYTQDGGYAKDADHVWYVMAPGGGMDASWGFSATMITGADPSTFSLDGSDSPYDAKDKQHGYLMGQIAQ
jgi:hypothetical protein